MLSCVFGYPLAREYTLRSCRQVEKQKARRMKRREAFIISLRMQGTLLHFYACPKKKYPSSPFYILNRLVPLLQFTRRERVFSAFAQIRHLQKRSAEAKKVRGPFYRSDRSVLQFITKVLQNY